MEIRFLLRRCSQLLLLCALLLPLLAACGRTAPASSISGAPTNAPVEPMPITNAVTTEPAAMAQKPSAAPVVGNADAGAEAPISALATPPPAAASSPSGPTGAPEWPVSNQRQNTLLKAGEVDDNADFNAYLDYLRDNNNLAAHHVDISERYILTITNERQQPVLDATVRIFDAQQEVFNARTLSGGKTIFFPRALPISANTTNFKVVIEKGNSRVEGSFARGQNSNPSFVLQGAEALPATPKLDVLFLLDATGSMGDEIVRIQETIVTIADRINQLQPRPELRFGLVSYRDRGDEYVTRVNDFTPDINIFQTLLMQTKADGGGDEPESMNEALHNAIQTMSWTDNAVRLTFLVADAPPHLDYEQDYDYVAEVHAATERGIKIYSIAASNTGDTAEYIMRQIAQQTLAHFIFLTYQEGQNAGAPGDSTTHHVDPDTFTVERLDDLVVQVIQRELAQAQGVS